ncbi:MAG: UDP-N-acetylmuramoyl-tripeptide--D-alanyl-D-alanine ligase [Bacilli bacterium]|nr:UDP-N-acetylmuramoyl-tripeptide--D-alanyl-D-alanine ligase [Bacilli bacterium]
MNVKFIISLLVLLIYTYFKTKKSFHMLQQNWYNEGFRYIKWMLKNLKLVFINLDLCFLALLVFLIFKVDSMLLMAIEVIMYTILSLRYINKEKREQVKLELKVTARVKRLFVTETILYLIPIILIYISFKENNLVTYYLIMGLLVYLNYIVTLIASYINTPIEKLLSLRFKIKAKRKLKSMPNLKVIGVTGSYGKTSSKNILNDILSIKYNVLPTPKNFNTPVGLTITINNYLDKFNDYMIAEMGAFKRGEVKYLCDYVKPTYGILTRIGTAHLESFGSQENIQKGKFELIESLPHDGIGVLNGDDELQVNYDLKNDCKIVFIGIDNKNVDVKAENIKLSNTGSTFDVVFKGDKTKYKFETKLLGKANIYNILAGIALGHELGLTIKQLQAGVKRVNTIEHRLELKKYYDINIIDDAYNSNPVGAKMALDVLKLMPGKRIVVTPGMIEMGSMQKELNHKFGEQIADAVDEVILVGKNQTKDIYEGIISKKFKKDKIHIINDVKEAFPMMQQLKEKDTYVLLENDLPDIFNEK